MVRRCRDVRPYGRHRIDKRCAVLDFQAVYGIRIVAAPDLRRIIEHPGVKPAPASAASLDQDIRVALHDALQEVIQAEDIVVEHPALPVSGRGVHVRDAPVHIPFDILDIPLVQDRADLIIDIVHHFFSGEVQDKLVPGAVGPAPRYHERPVRVLPVEAAVFIYHFRLDPDAELHPHSIDPADELSQAAAQLFLVDRPVAQPPELTVPVPEPAVVHDEHLDPQVRRLLSKLHQVLARKVKIKRFPAVQEDGADALFIFASAQMPAHAAVQVLGEFPDPFGRIA